jgi:hypothetical protein
VTMWHHPKDDKPFPSAPCPRRPAMSHCHLSPRFSALIGTACFIALTAASAATAQTAADRANAESSLANIAAFDLSISVHATPEAAGDPVSALSANEIANLLRASFERNFPGIRYQVRPVGSLGNGSGDDSAQLACRVWIDGTASPSVFQVRCHISTAERANIMNDGSYGYGPPEKVPEVVRQQVDNILAGFAARYFRVRGQP